MKKEIEYLGKKYKLEFKIFPTHARIEINGLDCRVMKNAPDITIKDLNDLEILKGHCLAAIENYEEQMRVKYLFTKWDGNL